MSPLLLQLLVFTAAGLAVWGLALLLQTGVGRSADTASSGEMLLRPNQKRGNWFSVLLQRVELRLLRAGNPVGMQSSDFLFAKAALGVSSGLAIHLAGAATVWVFVGAVGGFFLPDFWLQTHRKRRLRAIHRELPAALDTLSLMVSAGLDFNRGIDVYVDSHSSGELSREFRLVRRAMRVGTHRAEALRRMADRLDEPSVAYFVAEVNYSERTGSSMAQFLRRIAGDLRQKRLLDAERRAQTAPVRMLPVLIFLSLPCMFIVILTPVVIRASEFLR